MHDRRVVRGNTFAALVIPVSMQNDSVAFEKESAQKSGAKRRTNNVSNLI